MKPGVACFAFGLMVVPQVGAAQLATRIENAPSEGQCRAIAAEAPTEQGVKVLLARCREIAAERARIERERERERQLGARRTELRQSGDERKRARERCHAWEARQQRFMSMPVKERVNAMLDGHSFSEPDDCILLREIDEPR